MSEEWVTLTCEQRDKVFNASKLSVYISRTFFPDETDGIHTGWGDESFDDASPILKESVQVEGEHCKHRVRKDYLDDLLTRDITELGSLGVDKTDDVK